ncbi:MAG TPA: flavodoxin domain-containing protein [Bryobacteraceae bacterium]|nr:flavodoxin domain-containing protein [Bryobacteraceae bacterium]
MKPVLVVYATREGHSRRIAERVVDRIEGCGYQAAIIDAASVPPGFSLDRYSAALLTASVHRTKHEPEIIEFVKQHLETLNRLPAAFLSVSLSQAGAEDNNAAPERRAQAASGVQTMIRAFISETGWRPGRILPVAGALRYTKYGLLLRILMRWVSGRTGGATDTSTDHVYTNWSGVDHFVDEFLRSIPKQQ